METNQSKIVKKLITDYKNGKESGLEDLMLLTYKELYLISFSYLKDKMLAEDAVSETFVKLITKIHTIKNEKNLIGYIRTIVINKSLDIIRKRKKEFCPGDDFLNTIPANQDNAEGIQPVLKTLDSAECEVLLLWQYKYTLHEISQKTDFTVNQVRLLLKKAKANFIINFHKSMNI